MADDIDLANDQVDRVTALAEQQARQRAAQIPIGEPGECSVCGEDMPRLVYGRCAPCRDGRQRDPTWSPRDDDKGTV